jgi:alkanesulfonate monooxygenase SsuD/methylene tetrahydromethanopterin reductase-like flavin-dependent oxidoreductase (luciferase family)
VAGAIRHSVQRAARLGDGWYAGINLRLRAMEAEVAVYHWTLTMLGRNVADSAVAVNRLAIGAERSADAKTLADRYLGDELRAYSQGERLEQVAEEISLIGGPDELIRRANAYRAAGVTHIMTRLSLEDMPVEVVGQTIDTFGRHVIPAFA